MRVVSGNISFKESAPTSVGQMKDGEVWATTDGLYARVGNQVLFQSMGEGQWVQHFFNDATGWQLAGDMAWDGDSWNSNGITPTIQVNAGGSWYVGYRPTKMRVTFYSASGGGTNTFELRDGSSNVLASFSNPGDDQEHVSEANITFFGEDIYRMVVPNRTGWQLRNIEFFEDLF